MKHEDLLRIQEIGKEILFHVVDICEKHNIEYYLFYGTLIGSVRHNGYIPWDDDVDIAMTRENYLKFIEVSKTELSDKYHLVIMGSGSTDYVSEIKIGKKGTCYCLNGTQNLGIMSEVQVDIFCLDYIKPMTEGKLQKLRKFNECLRITKLNWDEKRLLMKCADKKSWIVALFAKITLLCAHLIRAIMTEKGIEYLIYKIYIDESHKSGILSTLSLNVDCCFNEKDFSPLAKGFEGRDLSIPKGYDNILKTYYGEYMNFPPVGKRNEERFENMFFHEELTK